MQHHTNDDQLHLQRKVHDPPQLMYRYDLREVVNPDDRRLITCPCWLAPCGTVRDRRMVNVMVIVAQPWSRIAEDDSFRGIPNLMAERNRDLYLRWRDGTGRIWQKNRARSDVLRAVRMVEMGGVEPPSRKLDRRHLQV